MDNVSLKMGTGSILALLGPNGAGKTTLTDMMCGDLEPDTGAIFVKGSRVQKDAQVTRRNIGGKIISDNPGWHSLITYSLQSVLNSTPSTKSRRSSNFSSMPASRVSKT